MPGFYDSKVKAYKHIDETIRTWIRDGAKKPLNIEYFMSELVLRYPTSQKAMREWIESADSRHPVIVQDGEILLMQKIKQSEEPG